MCSRARPGGGTRFTLAIILEVQARQPRGPRLAPIRREPQGEPRPSANFTSPGASFRLRARCEPPAGEITMSRKKPKIRHLAIMTLDPERLAKFYEQTFEMRRLPARRATGSKAVFMTDGYITLALLENKAEGKPPGL